MLFLIALVLTLAAGIGTSFLEVSYGFWVALLVLPVITILTVRLEKNLINSTSHSTGNEGAMIEASISIIVVLVGIAVVHLISFGIIAHQFSLAGLLVLLVVFFLMLGRSSRILRWVEGE